MELGACYPEPPCPFSCCPGVSGAGSPAELGLPKEERGDHCCGVRGLLGKPSVCVGLGWVPNGSVAASPPLHGLSIQNKTSTRQRTLGRGQGPPSTHRLLCLIAPAWAATVQGVQWAEPRVPGREATVACLPAATSLTWLCKPGAAASLFH